MRCGLFSFIARGEHRAGGIPAVPVLVMEFCIEKFGGTEKNPYLCSVGIIDKP